MAELANTWQNRCRRTGFLSERPYPEKYALGALFPLMEQLTDVRTPPPGSSPQFRAPIADS
jgi:hypothetical protein